MGKKPKSKKKSKSKSRDFSSIPVMDQTPVGGIVTNSEDLAQRRSTRLRFPSKILASSEFEGPYSHSIGRKSSIKVKKQVNWSPDVKTYCYNKSSSSEEGSYSDDGEDDEGEEGLYSDDGEDNEGEEGSCSVDGEVNEGVEGSHSDDGEDNEGDELNVDFEPTMTIDTKADEIEVSLVMAPCVADKTETNEFRQSSEIILEELFSNSGNQTIDSAGITSPPVEPILGKIGLLKKAQISLVSENEDVQVPTHIPLLGHSQWNNCLVGYFLSKKISYNYVKMWASKVWKTDCVNVRSLDNSFYIFEMKDAESLENVLSSGPHYFGGKFIVLQKWTPGMEFKKQDFSTLPTWVNLFNIPLDMWTTEGLSFIGSCIGTPLYMDKYTMDKSRLTYARLCIEIKAGYKVPKSFKLNLGYGNPINIRVEIPWLPASCTHCNSFGHTVIACPHCSRHKSLARTFGRYDDRPKSSHTYAKSDGGEKKEKEKGKEIAKPSVWVEVKKKKNACTISNNEIVHFNLSERADTSSSSGNRRRLAKKLIEFKEARAKGGVSMGNMFQSLRCDELESDEWPSLEESLQPT